MWADLPLCWASSPCCGAGGPGTALLMMSVTVSFRLQDSDRGPGPVSLSVASLNHIWFSQEHCGGQGWPVWVSGCVTATGRSGETGTQVPLICPPVSVKAGDT